MLNLPHIGQPILVGVDWGRFSCVENSTCNERNESYESHMPDYYWLFLHIITSVLTLLLLSLFLSVVLDA